MIIGWKNIAPRLQRNLTEAALSGAKIIEQILMDTEAVDYEKWPSGASGGVERGRCAKRRERTGSRFRPFAIVDSSHRPQKFAAEAVYEFSSQAEQCRNETRAVPRLTTMEVHP